MINPEKCLARLCDDLCSAYYNDCLPEFFEENDPVDLDFTVTPSGVVISCRVWLTLGGPTIFIDTSIDGLVYRHAANEFFRSIPKEVCFAVEEFFSAGLPWLM